MSYLQKAKEWEARRKAEQHSDEQPQATDRQNFVDHICRQLDDYGTAKFYSERLQEPVFIVNDWDDRLLTLPADALVFSLTELQNMATQNYSTEELKELATAKRELLAAHRRWLTDKQAREQPLAGIEAALKVFPGVVVLDMDKPPSDVQEPDKVCFVCKGRSFWAQLGGGQVCRKCHPEPRASER